MWSIQGGDQLWEVVFGDNYKGCNRKKWLLYGGMVCIETFTDTIVCRDKNMTKDGG